MDPLQPIPTTNLDEGTDSPLSAQTDLLEVVQRFNGIGLVPCSQYGTLNQAVTAIGALKRTLVYGADITVSANIVIPANIELLPYNGAVINHSTYTINYAGSTRRWDLSQKFNGTGVVTGLNEALPQWFGAKGDGTNADRLSIQYAINSAKTVRISQPTSYYKTDGPLTISSHHTIIFDNELTEIRMTSGSGYVIQLDGGTVESSAYKHVRLSGGTLSGLGNADCDGGFWLKGAYLVNIDNVHCRQFTKATANAGLLENVFNAKVSNSRFNCGTSKTDLQGANGLKVTITSGAEWNITQLCIDDNNLFQFNGTYGVVITREGSTGSIDSWSIRNNGIGHNGEAGVALLTSQLFAGSVSLNHIEGDGTYGVYAPQAGSSVDVCGNQIQDAQTAVFYNSIGEVSCNTIKGAAVTPDGSQVGIAFGVSAIAKVGENNIYSDWITTNSKRYTVSVGARLDFGIIQCTDAVFTSYYVSNAAIYNGVIVKITDASDYSKRFFISYGTSWYRIIPQFSDILTLTANSGTPNISSGGTIFKTANTAPTVITSIPGGYVSQQITILVQDNNTTFDFTTSTLKGNSGADLVAKIGDNLSCVYDGTDWYCIVGKS